jgi:hypothetical protein
MAIAQKRKQERLEAEERLRAESAQALAQMEPECQSAKEKFENAQERLFHARAERERRISAYDFVCDDPSKSEELKGIALQCVKDAEDTLGRVQEEVRAAEEELYKWKVTIQVQTQGNVGEDLGQEIPLAMFPDVIFGDMGDSAKPPTAGPLSLIRAAKLAFLCAIGIPTI